MVDFNGLPLTEDEERELLLHLLEMRLRRLPKDAVIKLYQFYKAMGR
jgi:hypothetical protein